MTEGYNILRGTPSTGIVLTGTLSTSYKGILVKTKDGKAPAKNIINVSNCKISEFKSEYDFVRLINSGANAGLYENTVDIAPPIKNCQKMQSKIKFIKDEDESMLAYGEDEYAEKFNF